MPSTSAGTSGSPDAGSRDAGSHDAGSHEAGSPPAVVLLSGGLDSATTAAVARRDGFALHALSVRYGQRHDAELAAAERVARSLGVVEHLVLDVPLDRFGGSSLTTDEPVPTGRDEAAMGADIPSTYVPARNTIFLSLAMGWAEAVGADDLFIGVNAVDYSGYPDCRPEFLAAFQDLAELATRRGVTGRPLQVHAPLLRLDKAEIVQLATDLGVDLAETVSCYLASPSGEACGECDACLLRRKGFAGAGIADPTRYRSRSAG